MVVARPAAARAFVELTARPLYHGQVIDKVVA
jgi:hypothetical protein